MSAANVLLADVGGTNLRLVLADAEHGVDHASLVSLRVAEHPSLEAAARGYLRAHGAKPEVAVFAVAGRVEQGHAQITNHPWQIDCTALRALLQIPRIKLVNDFAAMGASLAALGADDMAAIGPGLPDLAAATDGCFAVLGPGTGLGATAVLRRGGRWLVMETEGGHIGFAPQDALEIELLRVLAARFGRVSNERLICGSGLLNLYRALGEVRGEPAPALTPEAVTSDALRGDVLALAALERFALILGGVAGDLVLAYGAWDGVLLAGGLIPQLLPRLRG
ncbi:MAG: glucokinase, partial [Metallibacterium scheffleri]